MKKILLTIFAVAAVFALTGCEKKWTSSIELGVYGTRINCEDQLMQDFTITVFSNTDWNAEVTLGEDWLSIEETSGKNLGYIHAHHDDHFGDEARKGKIRIWTSGKEVVINVVQAGNKEKASEVPDELL